MEPQEYVMSEKSRDKIMLSEHVLEVRHEASGTFLDVRGYVADYIRQEVKFLPHWSIDINVVNFRDDPKKIVKEGAFAGFKSAGYVVLNPETMNFFPDRASAFWRHLLDNKHYELPKPIRFGTRAKFFTPSSKTFDEINKHMYEGFFTDKARTLFGANEQDLMFTVELKEGGFEVRITGGPIHKNEASRYFQFSSDHFDECGLFLDIDYYKTSDLSHKDVPQLLRSAVDLMWKKAERIAEGIGI
jgi:hypothetical protein